MQSQPSRRVAVVDIGSGTVHGAVFEPTRDGLRPIHARAAALRLLAGVSEGALRPEAMTSALRVLEELVAEARALGVETPTVLATSAVRDARNREALADGLRAATGLPLRVVDGAEEARMAARAVLHTLPLVDGCVADLGGGSLQLAEIRARRVHRVASVPAGALRLLLAHPPGDLPSADALAGMRRDVDAALASVPWLAEVRGPLVACGGTVRALARVDRRRRAAVLAHPHGQRLTRDAVETLLETASRTDAAGRAEIPGLPAHRADLLVPGALAVCRLLHHLRATQLRVASVGIREGALLGAPPRDASQVRARGLRLRFGRVGARLAEARADAAVALLDALVPEAGARHGPDAALEGHRPRECRSAAAPEDGPWTAWRALVYAAAWIDAAWALRPPEGGPLVALLGAPIHGFHEEEVYALADLLSEVPRGQLDPDVRARLRLVLELARAEAEGPPEVRGETVRLRVRGHVHGAVAQRFHATFGRRLVVDRAQRGKTSAAAQAS